MANPKQATKTIVTNALFVAFSRARDDFLGHFCVPRSIIVRTAEKKLKKNTEVVARQAFSVKFDVVREFGFELGED